MKLTSYSYAVEFQEHRKPHYSRFFFFAWASVLGHHKENSCEPDVDYTEQKGCHTFLLCFLSPWLSFTAMLTGNLKSLDFFFFP